MFYVSIPQAKNVCFFPLLSLHHQFDIRSVALNCTGGIVWFVSRIQCETMRSPSIAHLPQSDCRKSVALFGFVVDKLFVSLLWQFSRILRLSMRLHVVLLFTLINNAIFEVLLLLLRILQFLLKVTQQQKPKNIMNIPSNVFCVHVSKFWTSSKELRRRHECAFYIDMHFTVFKRSRKKKQITSLKT